MNLMIAWGVLMAITTHIASGPAPLDDSGPPVIHIGLAADPNAPTPIGDPGQWISAEDYPTAALRSGSSGISGVEMMIDAKGRVERCDVLSSSGSTLLDGMACGLLTARARFRPGTDEKGRAVPKPWQQRIRWQLPEASPEAREFKPFSFMLEFEISKAGQVENCKVVIRPENMPGDPCKSGEANSLFLPVLGKDGKPIRQKALYRMSLQPE